MSISVSSLSKEQQYAFERFKRGENLFITGAGGTGKTHLIHTLIEYANLKGWNYQVCAMTGCAAVLLNCGARTLHSWSGIKGANGKSDQIVSKVLQNRFALGAWKKIRVLIVDEVSMMSEKIFDIICEIAQCSRNTPQRGFGGIQVIFTGDFYQLPPVGNAYDESTSRFCFQSERWFDVFPLENHIELRTMFRQKDPVYCGILAQIRKGTLDLESCEILKAQVKREYVGQIPTKLFATRVRTDYVNNSMFAGIPESEVAIPCIRKTDYTKILETGEEFSPIQMANCQKLKTPMQKTEVVEHLIANTNCVPVLSLKRGAVVMCTVNLDLDQNICNGSQGVVVDFCSGVLDGTQTPVVHFSNGVVKQMEYHYWQSEEYPCIVVGQYPLCLAWALTIHKIQGATLNLAEIDIGNTIFEYGQTYVALSRVKSLEGLYLSAFNPHRIKANPTVKQFYSLMEKRGDSVMDQWWEGQEKTVVGGGVGGEGANPFDKYLYLEEEENEKKENEKKEDACEEDLCNAGEPLVIQGILDKGSESSGNVKRIFVSGLGR
jgi:ATP-dependent DNA helicase PIF1